VKCNTSSLFAYIFHTEHNCYNNIVCLFVCVFWSLIHYFWNKHFSLINCHKYHITGQKFDFTILQISIISSNMKGTKMPRWAEKFYILKRSKLSVSFCEMSNKNTEVKISLCKLCLLWNNLKLLKILCNLSHSHLKTKKAFANVINLFIVLSAWLSLGWFAVS
jgi:hypothetical protein